MTDGPPGPPAPPPGQRPLLDHGPLLDQGQLPAGSQLPAGGQLPGQRRAPGQNPPTGRSRVPVRRRARLAVLASLVLAGAVLGSVALAGGGPDARPAAAPEQQHPLPAAGPGGTGGPGGTPPAGEPATGGGTAPVATGQPAAPATDRAGDRGFRLNVPLPRARFVLTDTTGARYDFASRTRGRPTLLYFGYTHCPDQCPIMLADIAVALRQLPAAVRAKVTVVFVTTDPARDTPAVLARFLAQFDPAFIGLTGTAADVVRAQQAAQIPVSRPAVETTKAPAGATAHGGGALAYGLDDYAHLTYPAGTSVDDLTHDLPGLVTGPDNHT
ncbi:MAG TPA: SCO family protein [Mycobacteriales bacterium]|nr:SCO family protein [Mycobacteriales bacterium]